MFRATNEPPRYQHLLPKPVFDLGVPACGDDIKIPAGHCILTESNEQRIFLASVPPKSLSNDSIKVILKDNAAKLLAIAAQWTFGQSPPENSDQLRLTTKAMVNNYRSVLDYLARDIAKVCTFQPSGKLYFPIAAPSQPRPHFEKKLAESFPGLRQISPPLFRYLGDIQHYVDLQWLLNLNSIGNRSKHHELLPWDSVPCQSVVIHYQDVGLALGELGIRSIEIGETGAFGISDKDGTAYLVRGPDHITVESTSLKNADREISLERHNWISYGPAGTRQSLLGFLSLTDANVRRVVTNVTGCLTDKHWKPW